MESSHKMLVFFVVDAILRLRSVVRCQPISIAEPVTTPKIQILDRCCANAGERDNGAAVKMVYPPAGTGLFRDPMEVLGPSFPTKKTINTCEMHVSLIADTTSDIRFTRRGEKTCADVCSQYKANMKSDGLVQLALLQGYCNYLSNRAESVEHINLATSCTCVYRIKCENGSSTMMTYFFEVNCEGFVKVSVSEPNESKAIT